MLNLTTQHKLGILRMNILRFKQFNDEYIVQYERISIATSHSIDL